MFHEVTYLFINLLKLRQMCGVQFPAEATMNFFSWPPSPHRLCDTPSLLSNGHRGLLSQGKVTGVWSWPLTSN